MGIALGGGISRGQHAALDHLNLAGIGFQYSGVQVVNNAAAPAVYTDLNLSAIVGALRKLVLLKVKNRDVADRTYNFRPNGDADFLGTGGTGYSGNLMAVIPAGEATIIELPTDAAGLIEWQGAALAPPTDIWVIGYV